jgi:hypothetical protein
MKEHNELICDDDCLNCGTHLDRKTVNKLVVSQITPQGEMIEVEEWLICAECDTGMDALRRYVKMAL